MVGVLQPLLSNPPNRLAYAGVSYAAIAMLGPVMWDRGVWAPLALMFAASATQSPPGYATVPADTGDDELRAPGALTSDRDRHAAAQTANPTTQTLPRSR
jgi:hypothetical protein